MHCTLHRWMGHSWIPGISMSWLRFQTWFDKRICWTGDLLIKTCRNWSNHPSTHYIPIKHFLEDENFNVLIKLPFQYDIDVPFSQEKNCGLDFLPKNCGHDFSARSALLPIVAKLQTLLSNLLPHHVDSNLRWRSWLSLPSSSPHHHHTTIINFIIIKFHMIKGPAC